MTTHDGFPVAIIPKQDEITIGILSDGGVSIDQRSSVDGMTTSVWTANAQISILLAEAIMDAVSKFKARDASRPKTEGEAA